jgi:hypothetical protein
LAEWSDVQERVRREYSLDVDEEHEFALTIERRAEEGVRAQRVICREFEAWGRPMVEFRSAFGELGDYESTKLLEDNLHLPLGCVALHGRYLVLVHKECLDLISVDAVLYLLSRISLLADVLEGRRGGDRF